jgi:YhcH/YjgK/YiaL family protein
MICGRLEGWRTIAGVEGLEAGLEFLERTDLAALAPGKHAIQGEEVFALAMQAPSRDPGEAKFESHRDYIDIQFLLAGEEAMGLLPIGQLDGATPYDAAKDLIFYATPPRYQELRIPPGHFVALFPDEGHMPMCHAGGPHQLSKVVIKVKLSHWEARRKR